MSYQVVTFHHGLPAIYVGRMPKAKAELRRFATAMYMQHVIRGGEVRDVTKPKRRTYFNVGPNIASPLVANPR